MARLQPIRIVSANDFAATYKSILAGGEAKARRKREIGLNIGRAVADVEEGRRDSRNSKQRDRQLGQGDRARDQRDRALDQADTRIG